MKKLFYAFIMMIFFLSSCSSDEPIGGGGIDAEGEEQVVNISIEGIEEFEEVLSEARTLSSDNSTMEILYYLAKDGIATCRSLKQEDLSKGIIENLSPGNYRIALLAINPVRFYERTSDLRPYELDLYPNLGWTAPYDVLNLYSACGINDYFFNDIEFVVENSPIKKSIKLERMTSKIEVVPLDIDLSKKNISELTIYIASGPQTFNFKQKNSTTFEAFPGPYPAEIGMYSYLSSKYSKEELQNISEENPLELHVLSMEGIIEYPLYAYIEHDDKTVEQVLLKSSYKLEPNKILRLKGNLFNRGNTEIGDIEVEDEWGEVTEGSFD